jgi:hypothetical protein
MPPAYAYYPQTTATTSNYYVPTWTSNNSSTIGTQVVWQNWNATITHPAVQWVTTTSNIWQEWVSNVHYDYQYQYQRPTPEEQRAAREVYERQNRERLERRSAARARARVLLSEFLSDEQKAELERHGRFHVTGSRGRRYCIRAEGQSGNVDLLKPDGSVQARLCCHPRSIPGEPFYELVPEGDAWLVQMLEIRHDEDHFLRTANVHRGRLPADYHRELVRV